MGQISFHYFINEKEGGKTNKRAKELNDFHHDAPYHLEINTQKAEFFTKTGHVFPAYKYHSMDLQMSASTIEQETITV